ncbi:MAG: tRNA preQ1(34) S-adenosylmethionine ribosyltransferase-isomerase QueA [Candidatus Binatia bacterium]
MELKDFMYELPRSLIASYPSEDRAGARLMVVERDTGKIVHSDFSALGDFLSPGDLLVLNDSRVLPARLRGRKESGGSVEVLLLEPFPHWGDFWIALVDAAKRPRVGRRIFFSGGVYAEVIGVMGKGRYGLRFHHQGDFMEVLSKLGEPPLPPYIRRTRGLAPLDWDRYQTVYASSPGSVAAPTAGFHFTENLLEELELRGVERTFLTLHVGPATFRPVREHEVERHQMEAERYVLSALAAAKIERARSGGGRVVAVGSTTTRALEGIAQRKGIVEADQGVTRLFIRPGYSFRIIGGLITNFHLPGSTPLILVAAMAGLDLVRRAYQEAVRLGYRFYSYGDAMLIL